MLATAKPDPAAMSAFLAAHPETAAAMAVMKAHPPTPGFADSTFWGLNTFFFVNKAGVPTPVRSVFVPLQASQPARGGKLNTLFDALVRQMRGPAAMAVGVDGREPGRSAARRHAAVAERPSHHRRRNTHIDGYRDRRARKHPRINFDPLVLPDGIEPSEDPLLNARSAVYAASYRARTGEPKSPSVVQVDDVAP